MTSTYNVLIVDDHPLIIKAYDSALQHISKLDPNVNFNIETAADCDSAYQKITESQNNDGIDLVFLDIKLPPSKDGKIISGEDLGLKIREELDTVKIIISTMFDDNNRLHSILKNVNPDGFLIKSELTPDTLTDAITTVLTNPPYYSKPVLKLLRKMSTSNFVLDTIDRKLLYELSRGTKMKELPNILLLSIAALERRKRILKELFNVVGKGDRALIDTAEEKGFI
ncbi:response regulator [Snuella sedimenti]|uniref:Response regulator transcription factor n=1 Tax=Snuella sedimenti TaxID=2798802 RepID=A0A8J7ITH2_9FLAO|nr:response regulator [Snuella sedimenti]MBJ6367685.1 response regulator transcription factor [Snuella sedimenti]